MKRTKVFVLLGFVLFAVLLVSSTTQSFSAGIKSGALPPEGCTCHGPGGSAHPDGVSNGAVRLHFEIEGNPMVYTPGQAYNITFGALTTDVPAIAEGNRGGFNLKVTVGTLAAAPGWAEWIDAALLEATHSKKGDQQQGRNWSVVWTAPAAATEPAVFRLFINTVNGDDTPGAEDHWNGMTYVVLHEAGASVGAAGDAFNPEHIGVNWLAHWVGIVSFVAVIATLLIYYFVLKYGESIHTTDHRDRKEK